MKKLEPLSTGKFQTLENKEMAKIYGGATTVKEPTYQKITTYTADGDKVMDVNEGDDTPPGPIKA